MARLADAVPDELTSVGRILQFPPLPSIPEPIARQSFVIVEAIYRGAPRTAKPARAAARRSAR